MLSLGALHYGFDRLHDSMHLGGSRDMAEPLQRFLTAQVALYPVALAELKSGLKQSHWMWFIFPQLKGLGFSAMSQKFGPASSEEAKSYLAHPVLGHRLLECAALVVAARHKSAYEILGSPDDLKLQSCMTLFDTIAPAGSGFAEVLEVFFGGRRDVRTQAMLARPGRD